MRYERTSAQLGPFSAGSLPFRSRYCVSCNLIVWQKFPKSERPTATFARFCGTPPFVGRLPKGGDEMNEGAELATAGLVMAFAAVLLVASHLFIQSQSAKQLVKGSIDLKITTNTIASWL